MKFCMLIGFLIFSIPFNAMEKFKNIVNKSPHDVEKKEEHKTPREEKQKNRDTLRKEIRETKSESPAKGRASTIGKRASLDWTEAIKETIKQTHAEESLKKWSQKDEKEERLQKLFEEFSQADDKRKKEIYCIIMATSVVSATKEAMASNFFKLNYKMASLALYNIPGYYSTNHEEARHEIKAFYRALYEAKDAYVNQLSAEGPKRDKWQCEQIAMRDHHSPIVQLLAQLEALKQKHVEHAKDFEPELFALPEFKKP